ncbi:MAG: hypothetical protein M5R36_14135 [Deltaproteobacteria bacterium]|nr:hypothetical protein [Deltaproteobacteria bacterium]
MRFLSALLLYAVAAARLAAGVIIFSLMACRYRTWPVAGILVALLAAFPLAWAPLWAVYRKFRGKPAPLVPARLESWKNRGLRNRPRHGLSIRTAYAGGLLLWWTCLLAYFYGAFLFYFHADSSLPRTENTVVLWSQTDRYTPYEGALSDDGRYLIVTHARVTPHGGVSRFDLDTGAAVHITLDDEHAYYPTIFENDHQVLVTSSDFNTLAFRAVSGGTIYRFSLDPFALIDTESCSRPCPIRIVDGPGERNYLIQKDRRSAIIPFDGIKQPCAPEHEAWTVPKSVVGFENMEWMTSPPDHAWLTGEFGGQICLADLSALEIERCVTVGIGVWGTALDRRRHQLWVSRPLLYKVEVRRADTGELIDEIPQKGKPRPLAIDRESRRLFVGHFVSGNVDVVDLETRRVVRSFGTGRSLRRLIVDDRRNRLIAISHAGIFVVPLDA